MPLPSAYLVSTKNLLPILTALQSAKAPDKLTGPFLKSLGFTSSNDSLYIKLFREIGLIDSTGSPTDRYFKFLDQSQAKRIIAECIEEGYSDLFAISIKAYELPEADIKNKLKTLTQGQKEDNIVNLMAKTFKALCDYADWSKPKINNPVNQEQSPPADKHNKNPESPEDHPRDTKIKPSLHYNIEIHLPETRDNAVYDAIFKSLKEHLL